MFDEFEPVSAKQWKQKIQFDLKGADYNETLNWQSLEGIHVKPFYHRDDFNTPFTPIPGQPEYWNIGQSIFIDDETVANKLALNALNRGANAIYFSSEKKFDATKVFKGFPFAATAIYFDLQFLDEKFMKQLMTFLSNLPAGKSGKKASVFYNIDLLGNLARSGNWFHNQKTDHEILGKIAAANPSENIRSVDTTVYQNAGANNVQQLAYALSHANEYLNNLEPKGMMTFKIAVGSNYFFEIAKLRALRSLYAILAKEYGVSEQCHIMAFPSKRNKTLYDYNLNMLRTTTECMSAVLGGANTICNLPYDGLYHKSNEFGERIEGVGG
jgi:methylmalonyl-CoA mutase